MCQTDRFNFYLTHFLYNTAFNHLTLKLIIKVVICTGMKEQKCFQELYHMYLSAIKPIGKIKIMHIKNLLKNLMKILIYNFALLATESQCIYFSEPQDNLLT